MKTILLNNDYLAKTNELEKRISGVVYSNSLGNQISYILIDKDDVIGSIVFKYSIDEADILYFCIDEKHRGAGLSKELFNESLKQLLSKNIKTLFLEVNEKNIIALNLYIKLGFKEISRREKYYRGIDAAIVMKKEIC